MASADSSYAQSFLLSMTREFIKSNDLYFISLHLQILEFRNASQDFW